MYNHQPKDEPCSICIFLSGRETEHNKRSDIVFEDKNTIAFISPKWWINNPGHVIVASKKHFENIYDIPDNTLSRVYVIAKKISIALKEAYQCEGTSTRQHNEPAGNQDIWHFHIHVFPRYKNDDLYKRHDQSRFVEAKQRLPYAQKLQKYFLNYQHS
ncbi:HIT domain-containing protein [Candidatus Gottesmanbacteria bacterium]|nr:HIT domain-containing protein [Candidatus Gottesmanbacteria bacterium]